MNQPYKKRMSGKCPETVQNNNHTNSGHCHCPENVPKCDRFRHSVFVQNLSGQIFVWKSGSPKMDNIHYHLYDYL